jgi:hypothetical protein
VGAATEWVKLARTQLDRPETHASDLGFPHFGGHNYGAKEHSLSYRKGIAVLALAAPLSAQYGGPALLTRGQNPAAMTASQIDFRPYLNLSAGYDSGINGVGVNPNGTPVNEVSAAMDASVGVSGVHSWRHTQIGLDYRFNLRHYFRQSFYDGSDQMLLLGITHQLSRHVIFAIRTSAGLYTQNFNTPVLTSTVPFDPATTYVPTNDFFDNRTLYFSTQADLQVQKSTRLSYAVGADGFETRRRSTALYGVVGAGARGDIHYRISRRSTIGLGYNYTHYSYNHIFSSTDLHGFVATYGIRLTRQWEFSSTAGATRYETKFIQTVAIDPAIAALIGISSARQVSYSRNWIPTVQARLSYTMKRGVTYLSVGRSVVPGNGLFLTSTSTNASAGYAYTALRRWSASLAVAYNRSNSLGNFIGVYGDYAATATLSRQIVRYTHGILSANVRRFQSPDFNNYNKWSYGVRLGLGFTPGDIPIRMW